MTDFELSGDAARVLAVLYDRTRQGTRHASRSAMILLTTTPSMEMPLPRFDECLAELSRLTYIIIYDESIEITAAGINYIKDKSVTFHLSAKSINGNVCRTQIDFLLWLSRKGNVGETILVDPEEFIFNFEGCGDPLTDMKSILGFPNAKPITHCHMQSELLDGTRKAAILKELRKFGFIEQFSPDTERPVLEQLPAPEPGTMQALCPPDEGLVLKARYEAWFSSGPVRLTGAGAKVVEQEQSELLNAARLRRELLNWLGSSTGGQYSVVSVAGFFSQDRRYWWFGRRSVEVWDAIEYLIRERLADNIDSGNVDSRYSRPWPTLQITQAGLRCVEEFDGDARAMRETERYTSMGDNNFVNSPNINSAIQVGTTGSSQNYMPISDERQLAEQFVRLTRTLVESCEDDNLKLSLEAQVSVIEGELATEQPRWELLRKLGGSIQKICESAVGGALATALIKFPWPHI